MLGLKNNLIRNRTPRNRFSELKKLKNKGDGNTMRDKRRDKYYESIKEKRNTGLGNKIKSITEEDTKDLVNTTLENIRINPLQFADEILQLYTNINNYVGDPNTLFEANKLYEKFVGRQDLPPFNIIGYVRHAQQQYNQGFYLYDFNRNIDYIVDFQKLPVLLGNTIIKAYSIICEEVTHSEVYDATGTGARNGGDRALQRGAGGLI